MAQVRISEVPGNTQKLDGGAMFGNAPRTVWEKWIAPDALGRIPLACRALLIEFDNLKILCETGIGAFFEPKLAERFGVQNPNEHVLVNNLKSLGFAPSDIDYVILSHLHFDHAGGLLPSYEEIQKGNTDIIFSKAQFITSDVAFERAEKPHSRDKASFIPDLPKKLQDSGRLRLINASNPAKLFDNRMEFFISNGHTPGQLHTIFHGDRESVFFCGDLIPGRSWVHLPITMGYDRNPELLIDEKASLYRKANLSTWNFFYTHDNEVSCSKIQQDDKGKFVPTSPVPQARRLPI
jgi:glyoxylase-like metal-dependent hydrolase (beta-lactamase superfamily II)